MSAGASALAWRTGRARTFLLSLGVALAWLVVWSVAVRLLNVPHDFLPPPEAVLATLARLAVEPIGEGALLSHAAVSLGRFGLGFALALVVGIPLGLLMGMSRFADALVSPVFRALRFVPPIAWAPFAIVWFGVNVGSQAFVIFASSLPPILLNTWSGVRLADRNLQRAARTLGARRATLVRLVVLPCALPSIVAGLRVGIATAWMALVAAEIVAGTGGASGLGYLILIGQQTLRADLTIAAMLAIGLLGFALDVFLRELESHWLRWKA